MSSTRKWLEQWLDRNIEDDKEFGVEDALKLMQKYTMDVCEYMEFNADKYDQYKKENSLLREFAREALTISKCKTIIDSDIYKQVENLLEGDEGRG
jgi:hypothetical protein